MNEQAPASNKTIVARTGLSEVFLEDGILHYGYLAEGIDESLEEAKKTLAEIKKNVNGKKYPVLVHMEKLKSVSAGARAYHAGAESAQVYTAVALMINSPVAKVIGNFYLIVGRPIFPVRLFTSESEALVWLRSDRTA